MAVDPRDFAEQPLAYVEAAAGCGKTQLIVDAIHHLTETAGGRQLILTHTHAGVAALRARLRARGVPPAAYRLETIAAFAHRWATAYPGRSGFATPRPRESDEWAALNPAAERVVRIGPLADVLRRSYGGVFVDEYQDCTVDQHQLILALADVLLVRVVGDPLQAIFDFGNVPLVDLTDDRERVSPRIGDLTEPHRWSETNPELGEWLGGARERLLAGGDLPDPGDVVKALTIRGDRRYAERSAACRRCAEAGGTVVVIRENPSQAHAFAKKLGGLYQSMEEIEAKDLLSHVERIQTSRGVDRARAVLEFALECVTKRDHLSGMLNALENGNISRPRREERRRVAQALTRVVSTNDLAPVADVLAEIEAMPATRLYRRELFRGMIDTIRAHVADPSESLADTAWEVRQRARFGGRRVPNRAVSRTLLVKGLEFDHALVFRDDFDEEPKHLYVAITRGSRSLTLL